MHENIAYPDFILNDTAFSEDSKEVKVQIKLHFELKFKKLNDKSLKKTILKMV